MLLLYFLAAGLLLGLLTRGRLTGLAEVEFRWWPLALGGLAFQALLFSDFLGGKVGDAGPALYVASTLVVLVALARDLDLFGFPVIAVGAALNLLAIVANGGLMPADPAAFAAVFGTPAVPTDLFSNSQLIGPDTYLPFLGDVFVLPRPLPFANVFSIGDVLIGAGAVLFIIWAMHRRSAAPPAPAAAPVPADATEASIAARLRELGRIAGGAHGH